ncbi:hypothetical protein [Halopiger xanaduensis]|uniref:DUF8162 domain-containing protein n=1 Tax=Halopiger xanaduensis (strain DSM 18323 / JCM 14033 / SH-6) TaxID=797210 RepID=F8D7U2_HALXS|nr:hypothetical protein [Halopiger xanaduensis]AEH35548.1 hypothetical protein Halxa_0912 [Halopiger xanaduensis SH-6]
MTPPLPVAFVAALGRWLAFGALLLVPGLVATVLWAPFLLSNRLRALFRSLPPAGSTVPTYVLAGIGASVPYLAGFLAVLAFVDSSGVAWSNAFLKLCFQLGVLYVVGFPVLCAVGLPRFGVDWDPTGYGWRTWGLLVAGAAWYALLFTIPLALLSFVFALPGGY